MTLERGVVYRLWLSRPARIQGLPNERWIFPYLVDVTRSSLIDDGIEFEAYPAYTGPVTLLIDPPTPDSATDIVIWRDVAGTVRGDPNARGADDNWELGLEFGGGWHGRMAGGSAGAEYEGCVAVRRGRGRESRLSGCMLGLATYLRPGSGRLSILFLEPRWRLAGVPLSIERGGTEFGLGVRLGLFGSAEGGDAAWGGVNLLGIGFYLARGLGSVEHPSGWGVRLSAMDEMGEDGSVKIRSWAARLGVDYHF